MTHGTQTRRPGALTRALLAKQRLSLVAFLAERRIFLHVHCFAYPALTGRATRFARACMDVFRLTTKGARLVPALDEFGFMELRVFGSKTCLA